MGIPCLAALCSDPLDNEGGVMIISTDYAVWQPAGTMILYGVVHRKVMNAHLGTVSWLCYLCVLMV